MFTAREPTIYFVLAGFKSPRPVVGSGKFMVLCPMVSGLRGGVRRRAAGLQDAGQLGGGRGEEPDEGGGGGLQGA